jgi:hypothetical protein
MLLMIDPSKARKKIGMLCLLSQRRAASEMCPVAFSRIIESYPILLGKKRYRSGRLSFRRPSVIMSSACGLGLLA